MQRLGLAPDLLNQHLHLNKVFRWFTSRQHLITSLTQCKRTSQIRLCSCTNRKLCNMEGIVTSALINCFVNKGTLICYVCVLSHVRLFVTLWTVAAMLLCPCGLSRQEYWSGLPFPPPEDLPDPGMEPIFPTSPSLAGRFFSMESPGKHPVLVGKHQPKEQKVWGVIVRKVEFFHVNCSSEIRHEINNREKKTTFSN